MNAKKALIPIAILLVSALATRALVRSRPPAVPMAIDSPLQWEISRPFFPATDRNYATNHMWALPLEKGFRFGFSAYAVRLLQDVYFLDWDFDTGSQVAEKQEIGSIESKKAESALYSPMSGHLHTFNDQLPATLVWII